jgi:transposase
VGTAGKITMLDTSKKGDRYLRALLIHGARTVVQWCKTKDDALGRWIKQIIARRGKNKAVVALANKCARIAWVVLTRGEAYRASVITPSV